MFTPKMRTEFVSWCESNQYSDHTVYQYDADLSMFAEWCAKSGVPTSTWDELEQAFSAWVATQNWKPNTVRKRVATLRSYAKYHGNYGFLRNYRAPKPLPPRPHPVVEGKAGVVAMCDASKSPKQAALCALTGLMGLRVAEAISVEPDNVDEQRMELTVIGKGNKWRTVPIPKQAWPYIQPALKLARKHNTTIAPFSQSGARASIKLQGRRANLSQSVASHDMRSTFATEAYARSNDVVAVQRLLGHSDIKTTQVYIDVDDDRMRKAAGDD